MATGEGDAPAHLAAVNPLDPALADQLSQLGGPVELRLARQAQVAAVLDRSATAPTSRRAEATGRRRG